VAVNHNLYIGNVECYGNTGRSTSPSGSQNSGAGAVIYNVSYGTVEHSSFHDNGANGNGNAGLMIMESDHITAQYNQSYHNHTGGTSDGDGFDVDGGSTDCLVQYNFSFGNDGAGYLFAQPSGIAGQARNILRYNISENDGGKYQYGAIHFWNGGPGIDSLEIYNNTIYSSPLHGGTPNLIYFVGSAATNLQFQNNIFLTTSTGNIMTVPSGCPGCIFQYNDYWTGGGALNINWAGTNYTTVGTWSTATGMESAQKLSVDPMLMSPGGGVNGYKLQAGSPMINAGTTVTLPSRVAYSAPTQDYYGGTIPVGGACDIGANEYAGTSSPPTPVINSFSASPATVASGAASVLSWNTTNATSVSISPGIGTVSAAGSTSVAPGATTTYTLTASSSAGTVTGTVTVTVTATPSPAPTINSFTANPLSIVSGSPSTLSWSTSSATSETISPNVGTVGAAGSVSVSPTVTTTYTLTASNSAGTTTRSVTITVSPNKDTTPPTVSITSPSRGAVLTGTVTLSATATDNVGVVGVQFQINGINFGPELTGGVYSIPWDTTKVSNGGYTLTVTARDAAGNRSTDTAKVKVKNN
jgi:hypothetical protein